MRLEGLCTCLRAIADEDISRGQEDSVWHLQHAHRCPPQQLTQVMIICSQGLRTTPQMPAERYPTTQQARSTFEFLHDLYFQARLCRVAFWTSGVLYDISFPPKHQEHKLSIGAATRPAQPLRPDCWRCHGAFCRRLTAYTLLYFTLHFAEVGVRIHTLR